MSAAVYTAKQAYALNGLSAEWQPGREPSRQAVATLARNHPDLVEREWQDGCAQCTYYRLTPLGLSEQARIRAAFRPGASA